LSSKSLRVCRQPSPLLPTHPSKSSRVLAQVGLGLNHPFRLRILARWEALQIGLEQRMVYGELLVAPLLSI